MTDQDMIDQLLERHPSWVDGECLVTLRSKGIQALIRQAYAEGQESGRKRARAEQALRDIGHRASIPSSDIFGSIFGNKR